MTSAPTLVRAETVTGAGQVTSGASATGGAGVGALGVLLHPAQQISTSSVRKTLIVPPSLSSSSSLMHLTRRTRLPRQVAALGSIDCYGVHAAKLYETPPLTTSDALLASRREIVRPTLPNAATVDATR